MKKRTLLSLAIVLSVSAGYAQNLVITEVDAPSMICFNKPAFQLLTQKMNLAIVGDKMRVKIGQYNYTLIKTSDQDFKVETLTKEGTQIYSIKLNRTNSVVTSAEFTSVLVHKDLGKKDVWSLSAMSNPNEVSPAPTKIQRGSQEMATPMIAVHFTSDSGAVAPTLAETKKNQSKLIATMAAPNTKNDSRSMPTAPMIAVKFTSDSGAVKPTLTQTKKNQSKLIATMTAPNTKNDPSYIAVAPTITTKNDPKLVSSTSVATTKKEPGSPASTSVTIVKAGSVPAAITKNGPKLITSTSIAVTKNSHNEIIAPANTTPIKNNPRTVSPTIDASNTITPKNNPKTDSPVGAPGVKSTDVISPAVPSTPVKQ